MTKPKRPHELSLQKLAELARAGVAEKPLLSRMELRIEDVKRKLGQEQMDRELAALPPENDKPKACPKCGERVRVRARSMPRTFQSLSGTHTIRRHYHYCDDCKEGFYPLDYLLGLPKEGELSEEVEMRAADFAVNDVYELAERRWNLHYPNRVSANQFRQVAKRLGRMVEEASSVVVHGALLPPEAESAQTLYVMNDGGMVPMRDRKWNEVKVGVMFRAENHLSSRNAPRGALTRARYTAVLGEQEAFKNELAAAYSVENGISAACVIWLADGALGNWNLASVVSPKAIQILDWTHAVENGMKCAKAILGEGDACLPLWQQRLTSLLWAGDIEQLASELAECRRDNADKRCRDAIDELLGYYRANKERMRYADFLAAGHLIGSGIVESAHRHVIQTRMKRAGQHWSPKGGRQMARLRAAYRTSGPETFYAAIRWAHRQTQRAQLRLRPIKRWASNR